VTLTEELVGFLRIVQPATMDYLHVGKISNILLQTIQKILLIILVNYIFVLDYVYCLQSAIEIQRTQI